MAISFHSEDIQFELGERIRHKSWIRKYLSRQHKKTGSLAFIFTSNASLLRINKEYLNHNYFTDVITFDYSEGNLLSGDVFISLEQVRENAEFYKVSPEEELRRVMIHGILHLAGSKDTSPEQKVSMREMENEALHLWLKEE